MARTCVVHDFHGCSNMAFTTNYNWEVPDVGADFGTWGGISNAAFQLIDTKVFNVETRLAAAEAELGGPIAVTGNITATGNINSGATVNAVQLATAAPAAPNGSIFSSAFFQAGSDGVLNPLYWQLALNPSATGANRFGYMQIGDAVSLRKFGIKTTQLYVGQNDPTYIGSEQMRVQGSVHVDNTVTAALFNGSGASLTGIPTSGVAGLDAALAGKSAVGHTHTTGEVAGLNTFIDATNSTLAGKANTSHTHDASQITSGSFDWARVTPPGSLGYAAQTNISGLPRSHVVAAWDSTNSTTEAVSFNALASVVANVVNDLRARGLI